MPAKKDPKKSGLKPLTDKQKSAFRKEAEAEMKKHGFKTPEEYIRYIDSKRGY